MLRDGGNNVKAIYVRLNESLLERRNYRRFYCETTILKA
jgi:hypothetical protein